MPEHSIEGQDIQHQLPHGMVIVLTTHVRLKRQMPVGEEHRRGRVATFLLPELLVADPVCISKVLCRPMGASSLKHFQCCDQRFILAPQALQVFIFSAEVEFQVRPRRGFNRPNVGGIIHVDPLRKPSVDVVPSGVKMMVNAPSTGIPQRLVVAAISFVHYHPEGLDGVAEPAFLRLLFRPGEIEVHHLRIQTDVGVVVAVHDRVHRCLGDPGDFRVILPLQHLSSEAKIEEPQSLGPHGAIDTPEKGKMSAAVPEAGAIKILKEFLQNGAEASRD